MSKIKIVELSLRNFKGVKELKLSPAGNDLNVYGDNATGKTSIMDAFIWLLFDKDSSNSSNFNVKTLDSDGKPIHMLEHEVIATLDIDGHQVELQKIYKEKWTKKKGQADAELTGHATDYFINGVPKKLSEYKDYLAQIIDEDTFKILTNPLYFNRSLDWKKRRSIAMDICGLVDDLEVINQDNKLEGLKNLLVDKSIDDLKAEMAARRKKLNEELKSIPYRIDELSREDLDVDVKALNKERKNLQTKLYEIKNIGEVNYDIKIRELDSSISIHENEIKELERSLTREIKEDIDAVMESISNVKKSYYEAKIKFGQAEHAIDITKRDIDGKNKNIEKLRSEFKEVVSTEFSEHSTVCPTCKQSLPVEDIDKLKEEFDSKKQQHLSTLNELGKSHKKELEELIPRLDIYQKECLEAKEELSMLSEMVEDKNKKIKELEEQLNSIDVVATDEYQIINSKIKSLNVQKQGLQSLLENQDKTEEIKSLESQISTIDKEMAKVDLADENKKRVQDLKFRERELANLVADTEKIEFLCEQFIITKSNLLEDKLNSKFKLVKFKLFDVQVNGGINETFVTTVEGVPFEDLNNAMKINAGLDIIITLSKHYDLIAPVFLDNRESVNRIPEMDAQVINLIVSKDKTLKVEVEQ